MAKVLVAFPREGRGSVLGFSLSCSSAVLLLLSLLFVVDVCACCVWGGGMWRSENYTVGLALSLHVCVSCADGTGLPGCVPSTCTCWACANLHVFVVIVFETGSLIGW